MPKRTGGCPVTATGWKEPECRSASRLPRGLVPLLALALFPPVSRADWREFVPRPFENGVFLDVFTSYESDDYDHASRSSQWSDLFLREKVTLYSDGYVYHPRFLQYHLSLAGALKQEQYEASELPSIGWTNRHAVEYEARLFFLPEHHYHLQLFARRWEPLLREQSATQRNSVQTSIGAFYRYRKQPGFFHLSYKDDTIESGISISDVTHLSVGGEYIKHYRNGNEFSLAAAYNPSRFSNSLDLEGTAEDSVLTSVFKLGRARLRTALSQNTFEQDAIRTGHIESQRFTWVEQVTAYLPRNLRGDVLYRYQDRTTGYPQRGNQAALELSEVDKQLQFDVFHRLYDSLDTTYVLLHGNRTSDRGDSTTLSNSVAVNYSKAIPQGRFLAGLSFSRADTNNQGSTEVLNESYADTAVPGSFLLGQQNVEPSSIAVFLRSPLPPFEIIQLVESVHYTLTPLDVRIEIRIVTLPSQFAVPGNYDFFVSYALAAGTYELRSDAVGYNVRVQLLGRLLVPYYSSVTTQSDVRSGVFPGDPLDSMTRTAGLASERGALQGRIEHQSFDWDVSPYEAWRLELRSMGAFNETTNGNATTSYLNRRFQEGTTGPSPAPYTERIVAASASAQKRFPSHGMTLSAGGTFTLTDGLVDTTAYSLHSTLVWKIGQLDLTVSGVANSTDTSGGGFVATTRAHQYWYATLRRRLF